MSIVRSVNDLDSLYRLIKKDIATHCELITYVVDDGDIILILERPPSSEPVSLKFKVHLTLYESVFEQCKSIKKEVFRIIDTHCVDHNLLAEKEFKEAIVYSKEEYFAD
jgi:hypothetical protein